MRASLRFGSVALALVCGATQPACAADLVEAWQAAARNDRDHAVARAAIAAALPQREQAAALWRPTVGISATVGMGSNETETRGAQFSAPGFGQSAGVGFNTSVTGGTTGRWAISAVQPLYNPPRRAQQQQLALAVDVAELEWQAQGQALMLKTAERYFDLALAEESLRVLRRQLETVQQTTVEAQDRFSLGSVPVTDTHEARARLAGVRAQVLAADSDVQIKRNRLADSTGLPAAMLAARLPTAAADASAAEASSRALERWLADAQVGNPGVRKRQLATELAQQEARKYSPRSSATLDLVAQVGRERLSGSGDFGSAGNSAANRMIGLQFSMPLFTGGYRNAKEEEALRLAEKAAAELELMRQDVAQQVRAAWLGQSIGAERVQALADAVAASVARRDATRLGLQVGQRTTLDLLNADNDTAAATLALAQGRVGLLMDRLRLASLAGQLDETSLRAVDGELTAPPS